MIDDKFALNPLTEDVRRTCENMTPKDTESRVIIMPTHHICPVNLDMSGFRFDIPPSYPGS